MVSGSDSRKKVIDYYHTRESRWGYRLLLKGVKHFGYYPARAKRLSLQQAMTNMMDKVGQHLNLAKGARVLDAGCGEGATALRLASKFGLRVSGIDLLDFNIQNARRNAAKLGLAKRTDFQIMDYSQLRFPANTFDGVYTLETLVHAADYKQVLKEFRRVLKPGGKLVLFEYTISPYQDLTAEQKRIYHLIIEGTGMHSLPHFLHGKFPQILAQAGFTNISVKNISRRILPMTKRFYQLAILPYQLVRLFRAEKRFINTVWGVYHYRYANTDIWRYNIITANKPR